MSEREILVIDDDPIILMIHQAVLELALPGITCRYFEDAGDALLYLEGQAKSDKKFLLFLDINMPMISGWDLLEEINDSNFKDNISVVMVTSSVNESDKIKANTYGNIYDFISKPLKQEYIDKLKNIEEIRPFVSQQTD
ncbi:response regulator [Pedobacter aquatilis]|uniref:response regulator n=1 Tax=Pedobacter aquatilis TaxID=351343 RepID=UPI00292CE1A5|nr:response regulator [Pedobacter aquatilis]